MSEGCLGFAAESRGQSRRASAQRSRRRDRLLRDGYREDKPSQNLVRYSLAGVVVAVIVMIVVYQAGWWNASQST